MRSQTLKLLLIFFTSIHLISCNGQVNSESKQTNNNYREIIQPKPELDNQIWNVFQDSKGNYWFGSNGNGIYKFDGNNVIQYTTKDGLIHNQIRGIQEDKEGKLYIETPSGVSKFDGLNFTTLELVKSANNEWKLDQNDLWFNCNGNANHVYRYDGEKLYQLQLPRKNITDKLGIGEFETLNSPYTVFGIDKDKDGNLWFGTVLAGAFRYDGTSFLWIGEPELSRLPDGREPGVRSILEDKEGNIWLSNFYFKYRINSELANGYNKIPAVNLSSEITENSLLYFNSGIVDKQGDLWMTTYGGGVWKYDGVSLSNIKVNNGTEDVLLISIYQDNKGIIWLGTNNDGVYRQNGSGFKKFELKYK